MNLSFKQIPGIPKFSSNLKKLSLFLLFSLIVLSVLGYFVKNRILFSKKAIEQTETKKGNIVLNGKYLTDDEKSFAGEIIIILDNETTGKVDSALFSSFQKTQLDGSSVGKLTSDLVSSSLNEENYSQSAKTLNDQGLFQDKLRGIRPLFSSLKLKSNLTGEKTENLLYTNTTNVKYSNTTNKVKAFEPETNYFPIISNSYVLSFENEKADPKEICKKYQEQMKGKVLFCQPNNIFKPSSTLPPNDTYADPQRTGSWKKGSMCPIDTNGASTCPANEQHLCSDCTWSDLWNLDKIQATSAWDKGYEGNNIIVALVDTGVDISHEDLRNNLWTNTDEIPNNNIDDDNNGYIDDYQGRNFMPERFYYAVTDPNDPGKEGLCITGDRYPRLVFNNFNDDYGHGTHVAGIIAAEKDNQKGIAGVAPKAKIMAIRALDRFSGTTETIAQGIIFAVLNNADIINLSLGGNHDSLLQWSTITATRRGIFVSVSSGNSADDLKYVDPASVQTVMAVGASTTEDKRTEFSNYGQGLDILAPGGDSKTKFSCVNCFLPTQIPTNTPFPTYTPTPSWMPTQTPTPDVGHLNFAINNIYFRNGCSSSSNILSPSMKVDFVIRRSHPDYNDWSCHDGFCRRSEINLYDLMTPYKIYPDRFSGISIGGYIDIGLRLNNYFGMEFFDLVDNQNLLPFCQIKRENNQKFLRCSTATIDRFYIDKIEFVFDEALFRDGDGCINPQAWYPPLTLVLKNKNSGDNYNPPIRRFFVKYLDEEQFHYSENFYANIDGYIKLPTIPLRTNGETRFLVGREENNVKYYLQKTLYTRNRTSVCDFDVNRRYFVCDAKKITDGYLIDFADVYPQNQQNVNITTDANNLKKENNLQMELSCIDSRTNYCCANPYKYNILSLKSDWKGSAQANPPRDCGTGRTVTRLINYIDPFEFSCGLCQGRSSRYTFIGDKYLRMAGTSMASPHVAGAAALLKSKYPNLNNQVIKLIMSKTATDILDPENTNANLIGYDIYSGWGRLNTNQMIDFPQEQINRFPVARIISNLHGRGAPSFPLPINGDAYGDDFKKWELIYKQTDNDNETIVCQGTSQIRNSLLCNVNQSQVLGFPAVFYLKVYTNSNYWVTDGVFMFFEDPITPTPTPFCERAGNLNWHGVCNQNCEAVCESGYSRCSINSIGQPCLVPENGCIKHNYSLPTGQSKTSGVCCCVDLTSPTNTPTPTPSPTPNIIWQTEAESGQEGNQNVFYFPNDPKASNCAGIISKNINAQFYYLLGADITGSTYYLWSRIRPFSYVDSQHYEICYFFVSSPESCNEYINDGSLCYPHCAWKWVRTTLRNDLPNSDELWVSIKNFDVYLDKLIITADPNFVPTDQANIQPCQN